MTYAPPPKVGSEFNGGPSIGLRRRVANRYIVAAIVDLGFFDNDPTYYQIVFRFWSSHKKRWAWTIEGADVLDVGLYKPSATKRRRAS